MDTPEIAVIVIMAVGLVVWVGEPLVRGRRVRDAAEDARRDAIERLILQKETLYTAIRDLDFDHQTGKVDAEDHAVLRHQMEEEAAVVLRDLDLADPSADIDFAAEQHILAYRQKEGRCGTRFRADMPRLRDRTGGRRVPLSHLQPGRETRWDIAACTCSVARFLSLFPVFGCPHHINFSWIAGSLLLATGAVLVCVVSGWVWAEGHGSIGGVVQSAGRAVGSHRIMLIRFGPENDVQRTPGETDAQGGLPLPESAD